MNNKLPPPPLSYEDSPSGSQRGLPETIGPYRILRKLGEGAMGVVYLAHHDILGQTYALKMVAEHMISNRDAVKRFVREARHAARLNHPNLVKVVAADLHEHRHFLVMEYVEGKNLEQIREHHPLTHAQAVDYTIQVLQGLEYIHEQGILHRDIKAENVLIDGNNTARVTDFGLSLRAIEPRMTTPGTAMGTPCYMSPEQWKGLDLDARSDIFAVGVLFYYLLSGHYPFEGESAWEVMHRMEKGRHDSLYDIDTELQRILDRSLDLSPDRRYPNAREFRRVLEQWTQKHQKRPSTPPPAPQPPIASEPPMHSIPHTPAELASRPVEIAEGTYWVGKRPPGQIFYANPYLRVFHGDGNKQFHMIIDPGSGKDFAVMHAKTRSILGDMKRVGAVFINHQDPDVASSVGQLLGRYCPRAYVLCTEDTWRLVQYYNIERKQFIQIENYANGFRTPTRHLLKPVPSPFCHFVGAMMLYDPQTKVLFSGDLFGGLTDRNAQGLYADETDWVGIRAFHQIYMPTNQALRHAIANIRKLAPDVRIIAPQHGRIIRGAMVEEYMRRLEELPVGLDILGDRQQSPDEMQAWTTVLRRMLDTLEGLTGTSHGHKLFLDSILRDSLRRTQDGPVLTDLGKSSIERAVRILSVDLPPEIADAIKYEAVYAAGELELPTPNIDLEEGGDEANTSFIGS